MIVGFLHAFGRSFMNNIDNAKHTNHWITFSLQMVFAAAVVARPFAHTRETRNSFVLWFLWATTKIFHTVTNRTKRRRNMLCAECWAKLAFLARLLFVFTWRSNFSHLRVWRRSAIRCLRCSWITIFGFAKINLGWTDKKFACRCRPRRSSNCRMWPESDSSTRNANGEY